jgi:hypothetical protein
MYIVVFVETHKLLANQLLTTGPIDSKRINMLPVDLPSLLFYTFM